MSGWWTRSSLRLYPRRIRRGTAPSSSTSKTSCELSPGRLLRDSVVGAFLARSVRRRATVLAAVAVLAALVLTGLTLSGNHPRGKGTTGTTAVISEHVEQPIPYGQSNPYFRPDDSGSCYGGSSMTCHSAGCTPTPNRCVPLPPDGGRTPESDAGAHNQERRLTIKPSKLQVPL